MKCDACVKEKQYEGIQTYIKHVSIDWQHSDLVESLFGTISSSVIFICEGRKVMNYTCVPSHSSWRVC